MRFRFLSGFSVVRMVIVLLTAFMFAANPADWPQFRGPNGSGVSDASDLPVEFGPGKNLIWRTELAQGHSSPVISGGRIFLTAQEGGKLVTFCLDRRAGKILWRRVAPRDRASSLNRFNNAASPSPVSDGANVYVFFADFGLLSYGPDGAERWRLPLGPFDNIMGMAASPILAGGKLILVCDQDAGSYLIAVDPGNGKKLWRTERREYTRGYATPIVHRPGSGPLELIIPGAYEVAGYSLDNGDKLWWARGIAFEVKSLAVSDGEMLYVHGWSSTGDGPANEKLPPFSEALASHDTDKDGRFSETEAFFPMMRRRFSSYFDFDLDGFVDEGDWDNTQMRLAARNALLGVKLGGRGDLTESNIVWRYRTALPNVPSPLLYRNVLYLVKDGGILTSLNPKTGEVYKQARLPAALGRYWASPVAADGKVYLASEEGRVSVLKAGAEWEILATNDLADEIFATAAIEDGRIYFRTRGALYCFGPGD